MVPMIQHFGRAPSRSAGRPGMPAALLPLASRADVGGAARATAERDADRLVVRVGRTGDVTVTGRPAGLQRTSRVRAGTEIRDFRQDWRRWSLAERIGAVALAGLWFASAATALLIDTYLL